MIITRSNGALVEDDVVSRSMGASGTDVMLSPAAQRLFPFAVECKNVEALNVWAAWAQAEANAKGGLNPLLVIKRNKSSPLVVLDAEFFIRLVMEYPDAS